MQHFRSRTILICSFRRWCASKWLVPIDLFRGTFQERSGPPLHSRGRSYSRSFAWRTCPGPRQDFKTRGMGCDGARDDPDGGQEARQRRHAAETSLVVHGANQDRVRAAWPMCHV